MNDDHYVRSPELDDLMRRLLSNNKPGRFISADGIEFNCYVIDVRDTSRHTSLQSLDIILTTTGAPQGDWKT